MPHPIVLQVVPELNAGGVERTVIEVCEALIERGWGAHVASEGGRLSSQLEKMGVTLHTLPLASKNPFTLRKNASKLAKLARQNGVNVIHARSRAPAWSAYWAAQRTHTPFVTTYHGAYGGKSKPKVLYNSVMARGDVVIANSDYIANHVKSVHGIEDDRLVTIHRGVDLEAFSRSKVSDEDIARQRNQLGIAPGKKLIVLPGRLTEWKGQMTAVRAFAALPDTLKTSSELHLIGDPQGRYGYVADLRTVINEFNLDELVKISGHCEDMPTLYAAADLILAPSERPEAFGRVAAEALAMETPVIAADHGGQREIVRPGETGWLVRPRDPDALAEVITEALEMTTAQYELYCTNGLAHVRKNFSKRGLQDATLRVYERVLSERTATA